MTPTGGTVRVLFIVTTDSIWPSLASVWEACCADPRFLVRVVLAPNRYIDRQSKQFHGARAFLVDRDVPFTYDYDGILDDIRPDVVFVPLPYMDMLPPSLSEEALTACGARIAYVPYGLEMGGGGFNMQYQFNLPLHRTAWRIFARSASHRRMFGRYCSSGSGHVVVTGSPRLDQLARLDTVDASRLETGIKGRKAILWTPHFSTGKDPAWSSFDRLRDRVMELFSTLEESHVLILRPHPLLFPTLRGNGYWSVVDEARFRRRIDKAENIILDETSDYLPAFKTADAIMADAGSFLLEFFATGKPVLYTYPEGGMGLNDDAQLTEHLYVCRENEDLDRFVEAVGRGEDPMGEQRRTAIPAFLHRPASGTVGEAIADHVAAAVVAGDDSRATPPSSDERHTRARAYWTASSNTYLAPPAYYEKQEEVFRALLTKYGPWASAVDIGCGDGRFTRVLAEHARQVTACDVGPDLIAQAQAAAAEQRVTNVDWRVEALDEVRTLGRYDLVCCCGVLSGFLDIQAYAMAISMLRAMIQPGGLLITKETITLREQQIVDDGASGYVAVYRNGQDYVDSFVQQGFGLAARVVMASDPENGRENAFFVYRLA